jgi:hypothetical protein
MYPDLKGTGLQIGFDEQGRPVAVWMNELTGSFSQLKSYIPDFLKSPQSHYELYIERVTGDSRYGLTYIFDEWSAYILGTEAYVKDAYRGGLKANIATAEVTMNFVVFGASVGLMIKDREGQDFEKNNTQFIAILRNFIERSTLVINKAMQYEDEDGNHPYNRPALKNVIGRLQKDPQAGEIRRFLIETYGSQWTQQFLGFSDFEK